MLSQKFYKVLVAAGWADFTLPDALEKGAVPLIWKNVNPPGSVEGLHIKSIWPLVYRL